MTNKLHYKLIDIGANLTHPGFRNDLREVIERAKQAGYLLIYFKKVKRFKIDHFIFNESI